MIAARPLCCVCHRNPREPDSARCADCGPGKIFGLLPRPSRPAAPDAREQP